VIPDEAVEAAAAEVVRIFDGDFSGEASMVMARRILEAAAPHLMASAWDEGELAGFTNAGADQWGYDQKFNPYRKPTNAV